MIPLASLPDHGYAVLGLGRSGRAAARALALAGKRVLAWDDNETVRARAQALDIPLVDLRAADLAQVRSLVLSPGIPHTFPEPHPVTTKARAQGIEIIGDVELLFRAQPQATYIGITGTNGKSTTTALIGHILERARRDCEVGGNLGVPVMEFRPLALGGVYVLEMSSYQLELTPSLAFHVAVLLNITPDHLGRHGGMDGYVAAKRLIFGGQQPLRVAVVGQDDGYCRAISRELQARGDRRVIPISGREPAERGVFALGTRLYDDIDADAGEAVIDLRDARALPGEHNAQNAAAAFATARAAGIERTTTVAAILGFPGLAHRQESIAVVNGVRYVNDSKATNADAAIRALACYDTIYWIAGGRPKETGLAGVEPLLDRVRHVFLIGEAEPLFARQLTGLVGFSRCGTLDHAVAAARRMAEAERLSGAVVLLSPACASFDQFTDFEARGEAFRALVEAFEA